MRNAADRREIVMARWGMPSSPVALMEATKKRAQKLEAKGKPVDFKELLRLEPDSGNLGYDTIEGKKVPVWFAADEIRPLHAFAGIWTDGHPSARRRKGEATADLYGSLTCQPNVEILARYIPRRCRRS